VNKPVRIITPPDADEFNTTEPGLQWQWLANPRPEWLFQQDGQLRLYSVMSPDSVQNDWSLPNLLLQKFTAQHFTTTVKMSFHPKLENERTGIIIFGTDYASLELIRKTDGIHLQLRTCLNADKGKPDAVSNDTKLVDGNIYLRVSVTQNATCQFFYSRDGIQFIPVAGSFQAKPGRWVGAKMGIYCSRSGKTNDAGWVDVDWFRVE
jgi:beta-xylosidase